ncbi:MAG: PH domain-containing protein [Gemmatimonadetes bacterium]|nr:PH domain-containing protein [Gemmatimonadota bacterium]
MDRFEARLGAGIRWFTVAAVALVLGLAAYALARGEAWTALGLVGGLGLLSLLSVRGYGVDGRYLHVLRPGWSTRVALDDLVEVEPAPDLIRRSWSLWSTRGLFGTVGVLHLRGGGRVRAYVTDPRATLLLRFRGGRQVAVSPVRPETFSAALTGSLAAPALEVPQSPRALPLRTVTPERHGRTAVRDVEDTGAATLKQNGGGGRGGSSAAPGEMQMTREPIPPPPPELRQIMEENR